MQDYITRCGFYVRITRIDTHTDPFRQAATGEIGGSYANWDETGKCDIGHGQYDIILKMVPGEYTNVDGKTKIKILAPSSNGDGLWIGEYFDNGKWNVGYWWGNGKHKNCSKFDIPIYEEIVHSICYSHSGQVQIEKYGEIMKDPSTAFVLVFATDSTGKVILNSVRVDK